MISSKLCLMNCSCIKKANSFTSSIVAFGLLISLPIYSLNLAICSYKKSDTFPLLSQLTTFYSIAIKSPSLWESWLSKSLKGLILLSSYWIYFCNSVFYSIFYCSICFICKVCLLIYSIMSSACLLQTSRSCEPLGTLLSFY